MSRPIRIVLPDADTVIARAMEEWGLSARLATWGSFELNVGAPSTVSEYRDLLGDAEVVLLNATLPGELLERDSGLRMVSFIGLGAGSFVDLPRAAAHGIPVGVTPHYGDASVAEHAVALLFGVARRLTEGDRVMRDGGWELESGVELAGKSIGIVGFGGIGRRAAGLFAGLGMRVRAWARTAPADADEIGVEFVGLEELLRDSDAVSLHLALNEQTRGIITPALIDSMKPGALLINTARAGLITPGALESALAAGRIRAGLDVFDEEPLSPASKLFELPGVLLSPHQGYNTPAALRSMLTMAVENIEAYLSGRAFPTA